MKLHTKTMIFLAFAAVFLLTGCAAAAVPAAPAPAPDPAPVSTEPAVSVVADAGEYDVKIYTIDPNAPVEIIEESVPLASSTELDYVPGTPMTKAYTNEYGEDVYQLRLPYYAEYIIFSNGSAQTTDIPFPGGEVRYYPISETDSNGRNKVNTW